MKLEPVTYFGKRTRLERIALAIQQVPYDKRLLRLLNTAWWKEWFSLHPPAKMERTN
jgi:hypothetical protein